MKTILIDDLKGHEITEPTCIVFFGTEGWEESKKAKFELRGGGAELTFLGFIIGKQSSSFSFETVSHHSVPETKAHYHIRAALFDEASIDYKGNLVIDKPAQLADTYLAHHTLLLSDKARARTTPSLEIEADDVKAGHAATIGKVDKELLYYLQTRGIPEQTAEQLLIGAFLEDQLQMIPDEKIRDELRERIISSLPFSV